MYQCLASTCSRPTHPMVQVACEHAASLIPPDLPLVHCPLVPPLLKEPNFPKGYKKIWVSVEALQIQVRCMFAGPALLSLCPASRQKWQHDLSLWTGVDAHTYLCWVALACASSHSATHSVELTEFTQDLSLLCTKSQCLIKNPLIFSNSNK